MCKALDDLEAGAARDGEGQGHMGGFNYRDTTRSGACFHCRASTTEVCMECENFVGPECHTEHDKYEHTDIVRSKPAG